MEELEIISNAMAIIAKHLKEDPTNEGLIQIQNGLHDFIEGYLC